MDRAIGKTLTNFVYPDSKLHNLYCHIIMVVKIINHRPDWNIARDLRDTPPKWPFIFSQVMRTWKGKHFFFSNVRKVVRKTNLKHLKETSEIISFHRKGGSFNDIQQLRVPNLTQFLPPTLLEWTIVYILYRYFLNFVNVTKPGLSTDYLSTSSCPRSYWMTLDKDCAMFFCFDHEHITPEVTKDLNKNI